MVWRIDDPQGNEAGKIAHRVVPYARGKVGADIGCGPSKIFPHRPDRPEHVCIGVDSGKDTKLFGVQMRPDVVHDIATSTPFEDGTLDWIFSSHTLEHLDEPALALDAWMRALKVGGYLILYLPHKDLYPRIGQHGANPDHKHDFDNYDVRQLMLSLDHGWTLVEDDIRSRGREYSLFQVYRKEAEPDCRRFDVPDDGGCPRACVVRYGGFGDMLQAASVLPQLKEQGYHVTVMTTPKGRNILDGNPHIDAFIEQDENQVHPGALGGYLEAWAPEFDRFVNLCESVEGSLLKMPGRPDHSWPDAVRRQACNVNYHERTAAIARVPFQAHPRLFHFTPDDVASAFRKLAAAAPDATPEGTPDDQIAPKLVMWALAGSSIHKFYPGMDSVIARILIEHPQARIILVGDDACRLLEQGWENEPRVVRLSGELTIRETLTLACHMDVVIGPETGVLNAVAFDPKIGKVVLLSHSTHENLTKHWKRTAAITPPAEVDCYPCHRLHFNDRYCRRNLDSGAAECAHQIEPELVFDAFERALNGRAGRVIPIGAAA